MGVLFICKVRNMNISKYLTLSVFTLCLILMSCAEKNSAPSDFVLLSSIDPTIIEVPRYSTDENFLGRPVPGYTLSKIICTEQAAQRLKAAHDDFKRQGYTLVVYDGYRPQRAVNEFMRWSKDPSDQVAKARYYPTVDKRDVFKLGYVAEKSSHSRGSTFDLTLIPTNQPVKAITLRQHTLTNGTDIPFLDDNTVDMGSSFDLFHEASHHDSKLVTQQQNDLRQLLRDTMKKHGFKEYAEEWWHYTLADEPYPNTYFDFVMNK